MDKSVKWLMSLFEHAADANYITDLAGIIIDGNPAAEKMFGYSRSEFVGKTLADLGVLPSAQLAKAALLLAQNANGRATEFSGFILRKKDGSRLSVEISGIPFDMDGDTAVLSICRDVTKRKAIEIRLKESEEFNANLLRSAPYPFNVINPDTSIRYVNPALEKLTGFSSAELIGQKFPYSWWTDEMLAITPEKKFKEIISKGWRSLEGRFRNKSGEPFRVEVTLTPIRHGRNILYCLASWVDVTESTRVEEALRESEAKYRTILDNMDDVYYRIDLDGILTMINPSGARVFGFANPEEMIGINVNKTMYSDPGKRKPFLKALDRHGKLTNYELKLRRKDGEEVIIEDSPHYLYDDDGNPVAMEGLFRDITERKKTEKALGFAEDQLRHAQKLDAIGQLAGGVAHDFNNLLMIINGYSQLLLRNMEKDNPARSQVEEIKKAGDKAAALTYQLLAFSRKQVLQPKVLSLNKVIQEMDKMLHVLAGENVNITVKLDPDTGSMEIDSSQLEQVIINLVLNARDAIPDGGDLILETAGIEVDEERARESYGLLPGRYVLLTITDTGTGIDAEHLPRVFEPFFTTKKLGRGTGLGLSMVYGIVKQSRGHIDVKSKVGQGTTFSIYFPVVDVAPETKRRKESRRIEKAGGETVLLAEDDEMVRKLIYNVLTEGGYTVLQAENGDEALSIAREHDGAIDLLLTDIVMPGIGGQELAEKLSEKEPDLSVLYMSGYSDQVAQKAMDEPNREFLAKPIDPSLLLKKIRDILGQEIIS